MVSEILKVAMASMPLGSNLARVQNKSIKNDLKLKG